MLGVATIPYALTFVFGSAQQLAPVFAAKVTALLHGSAATTVNAKAAAVAATKAAGAAAAAAAAIAPKEVRWRLP